jgi:hypothetical protein
VFGHHAIVARKEARIEGKTRAQCVERFPAGFAYGRRQERGNNDLVQVPARGRNGTLPVR